MTLADLEAVLVDTVILHPETAADVAAILRPGDFADRYLGVAFWAAVSVAEAGGGYERVHAELVAQGVHTAPGDICQLLSLRGVAGQLPSSEAEVYAGIVADTARRRRLALLLAGAATSLQNGVVIDAIIDRLRAGLEAA